MTTSGSGEGQKNVPERTFNTFTGFPIYSDYSESVDKDTLIDEMQAKIGELLKVNQDLCEAKNEIEILRDDLSNQKQLLTTQRDEYESRIADLEDTIKEKDETISNQKMQILDLTEDKSQLEETIAQLKEKIARLQQQSDDDIQSRSDELRAVVEGKDQEIKDLKLQIDELRSAHVSSTDSAEQQKVENDKLQSRIEKQRNEIERQRAEYSRMRAKLEKQNEMITALEDQNKKLELANASAQGEVKHLKARDVIMKEKLSTREADYFAAKDELQRALSFSPGFENVNAMLEYVTAQQQEGVTLKNDLKKANLTVRKCLKTIQKYETAFQKLEEELSSSGLTIQSLETQVHHLKDKIATLTQTNEHQQRRLRILPVFDKSNRLLNRQIGLIRESINGEENIVSMRSVAALIVMINRWKNLTGTDKTYTEDSRNWWWMGSITSYQVTTDQISQKISTLNNQLSISNEQKQQLEQRLRDEQTKTVLIQSELDTTKGQLERESTKNEQLERDLRDLHTKIDGRVDPQKHQELLEKLTSVKDKYRKLKQTLKESDDEMEQVRAKLAQTKQQLTQQINVTKQKEQSLKDAQVELFQVKDGVAHLRQGSAIKSRDILSLERGLAKERNASASMRMQNALLVRENRRLGVQIDCIRSRLDAQP